MSRLDIVGLAKQADAATKQATMEYFPPVESCEVEHNSDEIDEEETSGTRHPARIEQGVEFWTLSVAGAARYASLGRLLSLWWGQPVTTTPDGVGAPSARNHQYLSGIPKEHSIFAVRKDPTPNITDLFWTCVGDELTLSIEPNGILKYEGTVIARELDPEQSPPSATLDTSARIVFDQVKVYASVDGGVEAEVKCRKWSMSYMNGIDTEDAVLGTRRLLSLEEGNTACEVQFTPAEALSEHYRRALQADPASVKLRMEALGSVIGAAVRFKLEIVNWLLEYLEAPANIDAGDRLREVEVTARGALDNASGDFVEANLVNTVASY